MPIPTQYTETDLKAFMHNCLMETASVLGWSVAAGQYDEAVISALLEYGTVTTAEECTDLRKLRALARVSVWEAVASATAGDHHYSADGGTFSPEQVHEHALVMLKAAKSAALSYSPEYRIFSDTLVAQDPYQYHEGDEQLHIPGKPIPDGRHI
jgi:acyl-homoserine lactone acylase PvdQ